MEIILAFLTYVSCLILIIFILGFKDGIKNFGKKAYALTILGIGIVFEIFLVTYLFYDNIATSRIDVSFKPIEELISSIRTNEKLVKTYKSDKCRVTITRELKFSFDKEIGIKIFKSPCSELENNKMVLEWIKITLDNDTEKLILK